MVRFSDAANSIIDGAPSVNNNNTNNNHDDDNGDDVLDSARTIINDGEETMQRSEEETTTVKVGQKRLPVTPHPANPNGKNAKKRSPASGVSGNGSGGNNDDSSNNNKNSSSIHAQTDACNIQEVESVRIIRRQQYCVSTDGRSVSLYYLLSPYLLLFM